MRRITFKVGKNKYRASTIWKNTILLTKFGSVVLYYNLKKNPLIHQETSINVSFIYFQQIFSVMRKV